MNSVRVQDIATDRQIQSWTHTVVDGTMFFCFPPEKNLLYSDI